MFLRKLSMVFCFCYMLFAMGCKQEERSKSKFKRINALKIDIKSNQLLSEIFNNYQLIPLFGLKQVTIDQIDKFLPLNNGYVILANGGKHLFRFDSKGQLMNSISPKQESINDFLVTNSDTFLHILYNNVSAKYRLYDLYEISSTPLKKSKYRCYAGVDTIAYFDPTDQNSRLNVYASDSIIFSGFPADQKLEDHIFYNRNPFQIFSPSFYFIEAFDNKIYAFNKGKLEATFEINLKNVITNNQIPKVLNKELIPHLISKDYSFCISYFTNNEGVMYFNYRRKDDLVHYLKAAKPFHFDSYVDDIGGLNFNFIPLYIEKESIYIFLGINDINEAHRNKKKSVQHSSFLKELTSVMNNKNNFNYILVKMNFKNEK